jgi:hypothetical protein
MGKSRVGRWLETAERLESMISKQITKRVGGGWRLDIQVAGVPVVVNSSFGSRREAREYWLRWVSTLARATRLT